jgi:hypothetical protein
VVHFFVFAVTFSLASLSAIRARAQVQAQGFAVERFYPAAPGGGWMVMDELNMQGRLGGVVAISSGYAYKPLQLTSPDGSQHLSVIKHQGFADVGVAVTHENLRVYLNLTSPLIIKGQSGSLGAYQFTDPDVSVGRIPDLVSDARLGFDARLIGDANSPLRFGLGAQLMIPNGIRSDYDTDGSLRGMFRALFAGDTGILTTAAQLGVHIRPLNDAPSPGSPRGSELLYGIAAGPRFAVTSDKRIRAVIGPEIYGETAFKAFLGSTTTALEGLITGRIEGTGEPGSKLRFKLSTGRGLHQQFGAPEWRIVFGVEMFDWKD